MSIPVTHKGQVVGRVTSVHYYDRDGIRYEAEISCRLYFSDGHWHLSNPFVPLTRGFNIVMEWVE